MKSILYSSGDIPGSGATYFNILCPVNNGGGVEATTGACPISAAGTIRNLQVHLNDAVTITFKSFTLMKNGVDTALTVTLLTGESDKSDLVNSVSVVAGDTVSLHEDLAGGNQTCFGQFRLEFEATAANTTVYGFGSGNSPNSAADVFASILAGSMSEANNTDALERSIVGEPGTITNWYLRVATAPAAGKSWTFVLVKNGTVQDGAGGTVNTAITITSAGTTGNASFSLSVAEGDYVSVKGTDVGDPATGSLRGCCTFVATTADQRLICGNSRGALTGGTTTEFNTPHGGDVTWTTNASSVMQRGGVESLVLGGLHAEINAAAGASKGWTFTLVKNGVDTTQTVTISGAVQTSATCDAASVTIADGDTWVIKAVPSGSPPTNLRAKWAFYFTALVTTPDPVTDPTGGGTIPAGTDPTLGVNICGAEVIVAWDEITPAGTSTIYRYAKVPINIDSTPKTPRVITFDKIDRALSGINWEFRGVTATAVYADHDRVLRGLEDTDSLINARVSRYVSTEAAIRARVIAPSSANLPRRVFDGVITDTEPLSGLQFRVQMSDYFSALLQEFAAKRTFPQRVFTVADFPNLGNDPQDPTSPGNPSLIGKPVPIGYGLLSDEALGVDSVCVVPAHYVGKRTVNGFADWQEFVFFSHAPSPGGILGASGELSGVRGKYPTSMEGVDFLWPGHAGWNMHTGSTALYRDFNGNRYGLFYARGPHADAAREGKVPFTVNVGGIESASDGTGTLLDGLYRQILHLFNNFIFGNWTSGAWLAPPVVPVDLYSRINTASFETLQTYSATLLAGGFKGAFMLGWDLETLTLVDVLREAAMSGAYKYGVNADGQLIAVMSNPAATLNRAIVDVTDILAESFTARRRRDQLGNTITYRYARRYQRDETFTVPAEGERLPDVNTVASSPEWGVDNQSLVDATSVTKYNTRPVDLSLSMIREAATANTIAAYELARLKNAPTMARFEEGPCGTGTDLGARDTVTAYEGMTGTGYTARSMQCERHILDVDDFSVEKEYVDLTGLPA